MGEAQASLVSRTQLGELPDIDLLGRFQQGDVEAFGVLLSRYRVPLYNFILRSVRDATQAEDLLQETFARVIQRAGDFENRSKFTTWLYTIARNQCIDHARKMKHRRHASLDGPAGRDSDAPALLDRVAGLEPDVERTASSEDLRRRIVAAVEALPEEQREVFLMRQTQHLPFGEIAIVVGVSENTIKSRMRYALERLQQSLADYRDHLEALSG